MRLNFLLYEMTFLKYFIPLIIEGNKRGLTSTVYFKNVNKYSNPVLHMNSLKQLSVDYGFNIVPVELINDPDSITFMVEGVGIEVIKQSKNIALTSMRDFTVHYEKYIDKVDHVCMPSEFFAKHYNKLNSKNLYLGSPKYDVELNRQNILDRYRLPDDKYVLLIYPSVPSLVSIGNIINQLKKMGYKVIVKTRRKNIVPNNLRGDFYFEDFSWFPHSTMELINISKFVINFDSTAIKECILLGVPSINFRIKDSFFGFLYNGGKYCINFNLFDVELFKNAIDKILNEDLEKEFSLSIKKYLFKKGNVSSKILDFLL